MTHAKISKINFSTTGAGCCFRSVADITSRLGFLQIFFSELGVCDLTVCFQEMFIESQKRTLEINKKEIICVQPKRLNLVFVYEDENTQ